MSSSWKNSRDLTCIYHMINDNIYKRPALRWAHVFVVILSWEHHTLHYTIKSYDEVIHLDWNHEWSHMMNDDEWCHIMKSHNELHDESQNEQFLFLNTINFVLNFEITRNRDWIPVLQISEAAHLTIRPTRLW